MTDFQDDREQILGDLRSQPAEAVAALPPSPPTTLADDKTATFIASGTRNGATVVRVGSLAEVAPTSATFLQKHNAPLQVVCEDAYQALPWAAAGIRARCAAPNKDDTCGVTGIVAAAADNGAMLLTDAVPHRLTLSLVPHYHIAIVETAKIAPALPDIWRQLDFPNTALPRGVTLVCGPSLTGDIEQTLTIGAHGPIAVLIVVIG